MSTDSDPGIQSIHQIALKSEDLDRSRQFYEVTLGARFLACFDPPGLLFFDFDGTRLLLDRNAGPGTLYFRVEDIHASHATLSEHGVHFESGIHTIFRDEEGLFGPPGYDESMVFFKDPDGNTLALAAQQPPE